MILLVLLLVLSTSVVALAVAVSLDGYGTRPGPRSHTPETFDPSAADVRQIVR